MTRGAMSCAGTSARPGEVQRAPRPFLLLACVVLLPAPVAAQVATPLPTPAPAQYRCAVVPVTPGPATLRAVCCERGMVTTLYGLRWESVGCDVVEVMR